MTMQTIGGYEIREEIGRGGMGVVYRGYDSKLDREVAIKVVENIDEENADHMTKTTHSELVETFKTEAKAIAKLNHPNIVNIFDFGVDQEKNYMVMEFMRGRDLSQMLRFKSPLNIDLVLKSVTQVCSALEYAHQTGIIHRDIKPANIILLDTGMSKLMDFGIARIQEAQSQLTQAGTILGSVLYISPEQLVSAKKVDKRADIYSLGITMYELLTGKFPYDGDNVASIISKIMQTEPEPPSIHNDKITPEIDAVVLKTIAKNPDERFQSAAELSEALNEILFILKGGAKSGSNTNFQSTVSSLSTTSFSRSLEFSLVEGIDEINLYSLVQRLIQTWNVENIGNKPILEALYGNENLSQVIIVSDKVLLLSYQGLLIGAVSKDPDKVSVEAYNQTANITKVDMKSCVPPEAQQEFIIILSSILGNGILLSKHEECSSNDIENIYARMMDNSFTGHVEEITKTEIKYRGYIEGKEIFSLISPNKNIEVKNHSKTDLEIYETKVRLIGPSLRRALISTRLETMSKSHGAGSSLKQLSLQKANKIFPELIEEAVRNTEVATIVDGEKNISLGKKTIKYSEIIKNFGPYNLLSWLTSNLLVKVSRNSKFNKIRQSFELIWNIKTTKLSQSIKLSDGSNKLFDLVCYDNNEKLILLARYSSQGSVSEIQTFIDDVANIKKDMPNNNLRGALYISGQDFFPELLRFYERNTKRESMFAFGSPKCYLKQGFNLFLIQENEGSYELISPKI